MYQLVLMIHVFIAICIVALVLVQQGKGSAIGAAFGSGASQTMFGSRGSGSFLLKTTIAFVVIFFATSISLNYIASRAIKQQQQVSLPVPVQLPDSSVAPVTPSSIPGDVSLPIGKK